MHIFTTTTTIIIIIIIIIILTWFYITVLAHTMAYNNVNISKIYTHTYIYTHTHTRACTHAHTHTRTHTHTHTHTYPMNGLYVINVHNSLPLDSALLMSLTFLTNLLPEVWVISNKQNRTFMISDHRSRYLSCDLGNPIPWVQPYMSDLYRFQCVAIETINLLNISPSFWVSWVPMEVMRRVWFVHKTHYWCDQSYK